MSNQALSQDEIDALFTGGGSAAGDGPPRGSRAPEVRLYDFRRPSRVSKDRQRTLEAMYGLLAKSLEGWLAGRVRAQVEVDLASVEQLTFGEFVLALPSPCTSFVFHIGKPGGAQAVLDMGRDFAFYAVERFLGSAAERMHVPERALTVLERRVIRIVGERVASLVQEIWGEHVDLGLTLARFESLPDMLQAANREDPVLMANLTVRFRGQESPILICLPFTVLDGFFATSAGTRVRTMGMTPAAARGDREGLEWALRRASVPVSVRLPRFELTLREVADLRPGGTLLTGLGRDTPVDVLIGATRRFTGLIGTMEGGLAVQIEEHVMEEEAGNG